MTSTIHPSPPPDSEPSDHLYNDDLLIDEESLRYAGVEFPGIFHVLDNKELRAAFSAIDKDAGTAKRRSQRAGSWAVICAVLSLAGASAEPLWRELPWLWPSFVAIVSALLGLAAAIIAVVGVLHGTQKDQWLLNRIRTERLRQFHFQAFIWKLPEIARSCKAIDVGARTQYQTDRRTTVEAFVHRLAGHADDELAAILAPTGGDRLWLYEADDSPPAVPGGFRPRSLVQGVPDDFGFEEQLGYAEHKLRLSNFALVFRRAPLRNQQQTLRVVWIVAFTLLVALHAALVVGHFAGWHALDSSLLHVGIVWLALIALGAKTLEVGFGLTREIERYEDYRAEVLDALQRFNRARTAAERLRAMMDMERISFDEMRSFLRAANESSFVPDGLPQSKPFDDAARRRPPANNNDDFRLNHQIILSSSCYFCFQLMLRSTADTLRDNDLGPSSGSNPAS